MNFVTIRYCLHPGCDPVLIIRNEMQYILIEKQAGALMLQNLLQKGGVPATPSGTATLLRLSPSY